MINLLSEDHHGLLIFDSKIKLKKTGSNTNSISTGTVQTDTLLINDDMSSYLNDLFPTAESKLQMAYYTFDRPAVVNGAVIIRSSNKLFIVR